MLSREDIERARHTLRIWAADDESGQCDELLAVLSCNNPYQIEEILDVKSDLRLLLNRVLRR